MKRTILKLLIFFILIVPITSVEGQPTFPLEISINLTIPYPTHLSDFTDPDERVFILVTNYGTESHQIVLTGSLRNETSGITIATNPSNPPTNPIIIEPGITQLTGSDLSELFDPVHLSFSVGVTAETIRDDQALPDGFYTLCIRAFDAFNPGRALSSDPNITLAGCATFDVSKIDAPDIINPANDEPFDPSIPNIYISWNWNRPTFGGDDVSFTLRIVETDPEGRDPNWVLQTSTTPELFYQSGILETFYNLSFPDDVTLEQGQSYVIQVIAVDDMGELIFENGGRSMPVVFYYDNPMFAVGEPFWRTENEITFDFGAEMELSYEIPINDDDEDGANLNTNIYIFRIPSDQTPEQAFEAGDFVQHVEIYDPLTNADNPHYFMTDFESMTYGNTYGAKIQLFDAFDRDDYLLENGGESGILVFNYGAPVIIPQPEWITRSGVSFDDPSDISLAYQIRMEEGTGFEMQLDGSIFYFEIPDGTTPEMAAQETSGLHRIDIASGEIFNERSVEREVLPFAEDIEFGRRYGAFIEISDSRHMADAMYRFENNGRSEILTFTMGAVSSGTDIVLTYPLDGDRIPFSFFPLIARYEPFNTQYQHWKSECTLIKDGSPDDFFTGDGLRWPGGSQAGQSTLGGLSEITEDESQNVAVFKNNDQRSIPFERGANYRWETNVKLYDVVEPTAVDPFLEFDKNSNFSRGMGPSDLLQPDWGAIIAPDSTFNFSWITSDAPEQLLPHHRINHVTRQRLTYFNGVVKEKWVLEVARSEAMDSIIHHLDGNIGNGVIDYLSGEYSEERILAELYKELESSTSFTPTDTGYYYWRVKWLENPDAGWDTPYYESSQVRPFWVGNSPPPGTTSRTTPEEGCVSECLSPEITNTTNLSSLTPGSTVNAGKFQMNVIEVTGSAGARFTGTGEIRIPYLNNLRVSVSFENISINNAMELFSGKIVAINDVPSISMDTTGIMIGGQRVSVPSMSETEAEILDAAITSTERLVSMMTDDRAIGMPIGLDNEIDGVSYVIGITEMTFKPRKAQLTAVMRVDIPSVGKYIPALGAKDVCFTPGGLGDEGRLYLHRDWTMTPEDSDVQFSFSGVESGDTTRATYVEWDCQGYKCMAIRGNVEFSTDMIVKEGADGEIIEGENVRANFGVKTCRGGNWIAEIGIDAFQIKGADGWGFHSATAYLDFSDIENPPSMVFPAAYDASYLGRGDSESPESSEESSSDRLRSTWKGFYLANLMLHVPSDFEDDVVGRVSFGVENMIVDFVDGGGLTISVAGYNIIDYENGSVDNLSFSLDTVRFSIVQSSIFEGGLSGQLGLPIFEEGDRLNYSGLFVHRSDTFGINFNVNVTDTLNVPMWQAEMFLAPESTIGITHKSGSEGTKTYVYTDLTGGIDIVGDFLSSDGGGVPGVEFKGIRFEHIVYNSDGSQFDIADFSFASAQKSTAGFPVNINDIGIDISMPRVGITFDLALVLSDAGFTAEAGLGIYGAFDFSGDRETFRFDGIDLTSIRISKTANGITLDGGLEFYNNDATYGDGVKGFIRVVLPMGIEGSLTVQFGTKKTPGIENPVFNTRDFYPYWYVDGLIRIPAGVTIFSGFAIYGFGGGVYYRMRPDYSALTSTASMFGEEGEEPASGVRYIPDWETFGFKIMAILGTQPSEQAFNMDVTIEMSFTSAGGLGSFSIDGAGYVMVSFEDRPEAKVYATVHFAYINPGDGSERVEGDFAIYVDFGDFLYGAGSEKRFVHAEFLVQDDIWYYYMGRADDRGGLVIDIPGLRLDLLTYLMIGHGIPRRLPPLPDFIAQLVYGPPSDLSSGAVNPSNIDSRERSATDEKQLSDAEGFAMGVSLHISTRFEFAIFYAELEAMFGFDVLVNKDPERVCVQTGLHPGIHDWYAMGQMYAGLRGEMGVFVDLFFIKGEFPFIELAAAISMRGGLPNPIWIEGRAGLYYRILNGMVEGQCNFVVTVGEKCSPVDENPLSGIDFIADISPGNSATDVSVFASSAVSFNLPVNKLLELPAGLDDDPDKVRVFRPYIEKFTITNVQSGGNTIVSGMFGFSESNTIANFIFTNHEAFEEYNRYKVQVVVQAFEHFPNGSQVLIKDRGRTWQDTKTIFFATGARPDVMVDEQIAYSYPISDQAYFLQEETNNSFGLVRNIDRTQEYLFERTIDDVDYDYVARFKPVSGGDPLEGVVNSTSRGITFKLPDLENETYYVVQIVRKPSQTMAEQASESIGSLTSSGVTGALQPISKNFNFDDFSVTVKLGNKLPGEYVRSGETLLYHYYFRTSRYNSLREKLADLDFEIEKISSPIELFKLSGDIPEKFEEYEINGYYKGGVKRLEPLLKFVAPFTYNYHTQNVNPKVYEVYWTLNNLKRSDPVLRDILLPIFNRHRRGLPPILGVDLSSRTDVGFPIQDWEIERQAGVRRQPESSSDDTASTSSGSSGSATATGPSISTSPGSGLSASGGIGGVSVSNPGVSSLFAGTSSNIFSASILEPSGSSSRTYDLELFYTTSTYVKLDVVNLKRSLSRIFLYRDAAGRYRYQLQLSSQHRTEYLQLLSALTTNNATFNYSRGTYGFSIQYHMPILGGGGYASPSQRKNSELTQIFNY